MTIFAEARASANLRPLATIPHYDGDLQAEIGLHGPYKSLQRPFALLMVL